MFFSEKGVKKSNLEKNIYPWILRPFGPVMKRPPPAHFRHLIHHVDSDNSGNRGIKSIEGKRTSVQCPLGRILFNVKIATETE